MIYSFMLIVQSAETNIAPARKLIQKETIVFQPFFSGAMLVSGRVVFKLGRWRAVDGAMAMTKNV